MGLGVSIFLTAIGAILAFAVNKHVNGISVHMIGWILMIVGIVGGVISMIYWQSWAGPGSLTRRRTVVDEPPAPG
jgi:predicted anti-sigma-YlaC factor YlaD